MIDPHVHLRDWGEASKETLTHGFKIARGLGFSGVFEMPNTDPPLLTRTLLEKRLRDADLALSSRRGDFFHGVYAGLTEDGNQIAEMVRAVREITRVVGLKLFTCASTGNLGIIDADKQAWIYAKLGKLGYSGVLAVHCEKESSFGPELWDPMRPETHGAARPPEAETASVEDQIRFARDGGFAGSLHICHVSVPDTLRLIEDARGRMPFALSCEITPHHALLWDELLAQPEGICLKVNPPLRPKRMQEEMLKALLQNRITFIGSDHAPHTLGDKLDRAASGLPSFALYPLLVFVLAKEGMSQDLFIRLRRRNIFDLFGIRESAVPETAADTADAVGDFGYESFPRTLVSHIAGSYFYV